MRSTATIIEHRVKPQEKADQAEAPANVVTRWEDVPVFESEFEEAAWWRRSRVDLRLMDASVADPAEVAESVTITLRIDPRMLSRIKRLARARYLNYQSMIKQWLSERMEQELRDR